MIDKDEKQKVVIKSNNIFAEPQPKAPVAKKEEKIQKITEKGQ